MNDPLIREKFKAQYLNQFNRENCQIYDELGLLRGASIVDLALLTPTYFQGFEIKSGEDTLGRLPNQIKHYDQVFDFITIITEQEHYHAVRNAIPPYWGIVLTQKIRDQVTFDYVRRPTFNSYTNTNSICQLLWKEEVYAILKEKGIKGISKLPRTKLWDVLVENATKEEIRKLVWKALKDRTTWKTSF